MYTNTGNKIKHIAKILFIAGELTAIITGLILISLNIFLSILCLIFIPILSAALSLILYGYGEIVEIAEKLNSILKNK